MSLNTAHVQGGVLLHAGERILLYCKNTTLEFSGSNHQAMKGSKSGRIYLTTHRMVFNNGNSSDALKSFSFPFCTIREVELEQPVFGANHIKGTVRAQPDGNWTGEAKFKLYFKSGGAIEYAMAMKQAERLTRQQSFNAPPPPYTPHGQWFPAPPPAYTPPTTGYYGWNPPPANPYFNEVPAGNSVYVSDQPPPYPGIYSPPPPQPGAPPPVGFYDPVNAQNAYLPQYTEHPPSYDDAVKHSK